MTDSQSSVVESLRKRYLVEYRSIHNKDDRLAFFKEIGEAADAAGLAAWVEFAHGMSALLGDDSEAALGFFDKAIALDPAFACGWHGKGNALYMQKRWGEAMDAYGKAIDLAPGYAYPWNGKGNVLYQQKRWGEAIAAYERSIALDTGYCHPWNGKGSVLAERKHYDEALVAYGKAIELAPACVDPWNGKGNVHKQRRCWEEALVAYETAIAIDPRAAAPWCGKGDVLREQRRWAEAVVAYEKAIVLAPLHSNPWNGKGNVLDDLGRHDEALAAYHRAIELDPGSPHPWNGKGNVLAGREHYDEALEAYEKAIELDHDYAPAWNGKGNVLAKQARHREALEAYEKAVSLSPTCAEYPYNIGLLRWAQKKPGDALTAFSRAIALGLGQPWKDVAETWVKRARRAMESERTAGPSVASERVDRASDEALMTTLAEAIRADVPSICTKKAEFKKRITEYVCRERLVGSAGADDMLLVLRDWNSFSPLVPRELRQPGSRGPDDWRGGGYLLVWKGHGVVVDPGVGFVTQLYRRGLSIADVDAVIVTHCHLDHTRDVESLVDLNYRYNKFKGFVPGQQGFRQLQFWLCDSALTKYREYLKACRCCEVPRQLVRGGDAVRMSDLIEVQAISVQHKDINERDDEAIGLVFVLREAIEPVVKVGLTSDSRWFEGLAAGFAGCNVLVAHLGTIEVGDENPGETEAGQAGAGPSQERAQQGFLSNYLENHLGAKGCFRLLHGVKPKILVVGEVGEELMETRFKVVQVLDQLKPEETTRVLGGDSNLVIGLGKELSVCCSHPGCARSWTRIPLREVRPVMGGDFLFQYTCKQHGLVDERG